MRAARLQRVVNKGLYVPAPEVPEEPIDGWSANLPGWGQRVFFEDFNTNAAEGSFLSTYTNFAAYDGPFAYVTNQKPSEGGNGNHYSAGLISASGGSMFLRSMRNTTTGKYMTTAPIPKITGYGQLYGRYSCRWRVITANNLVKTAWLLWPDSEIWPRDGEIDLPEGSLTGTIEAFMHRQNATLGSDQDHWNSGIAYGVGVWHTTTLEWKANAFQFHCDNASSPVYTSRVPNTKMHFVMQTEPNLGGAQPVGQSLIEVDRVAIWKAP